MNFTLKRQILDKGKSYEMCLLKCCIKDLNFQASNTRQMIEIDKFLKVKKINFVKFLMFNVINIWIFVNGKRGTMWMDG
jgi:hypothetical protein